MHSLNLNARNVLFLSVILLLFNCKRKSDNTKEFNLIVQTCLDTIYKGIPDSIKYSYLYDVNNLVLLKSNYITDSASLKWGRFPISIKLFADSTVKLLEHDIWLDESKPINLFKIDTMWINHADAYLRLLAVTTGDEHEFNLRYNSKWFITKYKSMGYRKTPGPTIIQDK